MTYLERVSLEILDLKGRAKGERRYRVREYDMIYERQVNKLDFIKMKTYVMKNELSRSKNTRHIIKILVKDKFDKELMFKMYKGCLKHTQKRKMNM